MMKTELMLMAQYDSKPLIEINVVRRDFFNELSLPTFIRKLDNGDIQLACVRLNPSQKGLRMISLQELAAYIDEQVKIAQREFGTR